MNGIYFTFFTSWWLFFYFFCKSEHFLDFAQVKQKIFLLNVQVGFSYSLANILFWIQWQGLVQWSYLSVCVEKRSLLSGDHNHDLCSVPDLPHSGGQTHLQVRIPSPPPPPPPRPRAEMKNCNENLRKSPRKLFAKDIKNSCNCKYSQGTKRAASRTFTVLRELDDCGEFSILKHKGNISKYPKMVNISRRKKLFSFQTYFFLLLFFLLSCSYSFSY